MSRSDLVRRLSNAPMNEPRYYARFAKRPYEMVQEYVDGELVYLMEWEGMTPFAVAKHFNQRGVRAPLGDWTHLDVGVVYREAVRRREDYAHSLQSRPSTPELVTPDSWDVEVSELDYSLYEAA